MEGRRIKAGGKYRERREGGRRSEWLCGMENGGERSKIRREK